MSSWPLLLLITTAWLFWAFATAARLAVEDARRQVPEDQRRGVSLLPVIPVLPLVLWGVALLVDLVAEPWGTRVVGFAHVVMAVLAAGSFVRDLWLVRPLNRSA
jgi:hypothetical protein